MMNTNNLNLIVQDTPIWYDPGRGPKVEFAMTYSNENSNTGFFGPGWRCQYDMRVFFLPSYYENYPTLQVHRADNRIETYEWDGFSSYQPRTGMGNYGYRDTIEKLQDGTVVLTLREGGKYRFKTDGHIYEIENNVGKKVTCTWQGDTLQSITDANGRTTQIDITYPGGNKQITITLPTGESYDDGRTAVFDYDSQGRLTGITDMREYQSTFTYDALAWENPNFPTTLLKQNVTESEPPTGGNLKVEDPSAFPPSGAIRIVGTTEVMGYGDTGFDSEDYPVFKYIVRGEPRCAASENSAVELISVPYLQTIETPAGKTKFEYEWWMIDDNTMPIVGLHKVYERGPNEESYPTVPTRHYAWCPTIDAEYTKVVRYPESVGGGSGCEVHWGGGLTKRYQASSEGSKEDALGLIVDESGKTLVNYTYDAYRNRTSAADGRGYVTRFTFGAYHEVLTRTDPMNNTWSYTYENYRVKTVRDSYNNLIAKYTYNAAGQIEKIESEMPPGTTVTLTENGYDNEGRLDHTIDGLEKTTSYGYETEPGSRGFLISVEDPEHNVTSYTYDAKGRRHSVTDPRLNTTTYDYDNLDRLVKVTNADSTTVEYGYTCCGLDWKMDENGKVTHYQYDDKNRLSTVTDANGGVTTYNYNGQILDRLDSITDAEGNMTSYQYYANGAVDKITFPDGTWEHYVYDDAGNLVTKSNGKDAQTERTITYGYDPNNRLVSVCSDPP
jgi:YD repeat-containing protein